MKTLFKQALLLLSLVAVPAFTQVNDRATLFHLKGNVKSIKLYCGTALWASCTFNAKGEWTYIDACLNNTYSIIPGHDNYCENERDEQGRLTMLFYDDVRVWNRYHFSYEGTTLIVTSDAQDNFTQTNEKYTYSHNATGDPTKHTYHTEETTCDLTARGTETYTILARDSQGNWTRRKCTRSDGSPTIIQTRRITYFTSAPSYRKR